MADFYISQGDLLPVLVATVSDANGAYSLTGATVTFHLAKKDDGTVIVSRAATADADQVTNKGKFSYAWQAGDTDLSGDFLAEVRVLVGGTIPATFPNTEPKIAVRIAPKVA